MSWNPSPQNLLFERNLMAPVIRTIIADDEVLAREKLRILLSAEPGIQIIAECRSGKETVSALQAHRPDLLLLDIQMPDSDGFEVLKSIPSEEMPIVVFTTAYDQYAIKAFEARALDYLLKPFDQERLHDTMDRARSELRKARNPDITKQILATTCRSENVPAAKQYWTCCRKTRPYPIRPHTSFHHCKHRQHQGTAALQQRRIHGDAAKR
ncbi:MAG: hypothetical protein DMG74_16140 [Acidobacteria bacterium]|nr:MAG: hypothetical protein DMG74_16140 [Acidobacteriota bacterium]